MELLDKDKHQAKLICDSSQRKLMNQVIVNPTRLHNILDLLFTSDEIVCDMRHERHAHISDHDTVTLKMDLEIPKDDNDVKKNFCFTDN